MTISSEHHQSAVSLAAVGGSSVAPAGNGFAEPQRQRRPASRVWQRFRRHRLAMTGAVLLGILIVAAIGAPLFARYSPYEVDIRAARSAPSIDHWLGTDAAGRDVFSRLLYAGRVSLMVGVLAVAINTFIGLVVGSLAGFYGGRVDATLMRAADVVLSFPSLVVVVTIVSLFGPRLSTLILVIGLLGWPPAARIVRGQILSLREREFVLASRALGAGSVRIIFRHLLPNAMAPLIVLATFAMAQTILLEAGLSFLGLGVQPPTASWGNMLFDAQSITVLERMPWLWVPPGLMIAITVLAINFIGDGLRDAFDPGLNER